MIESLKELLVVINDVAPQGIALVALMVVALALIVLLAFIRLLR